MPPDRRRRSRDWGCVERLRTTNDGQRVHRSDRGVSMKTSTTRTVVRRPACLDGGEPEARVRISGGASRPRQQLSTRLSTRGRPGRPSHPSRSGRPCRSRSRRSPPASWRHRRHGQRARLASSDRRSGPGPQGFRGRSRIPSGSDRPASRRSSTPPHRPGRRRGAG